jgi:hypothetical protein
MPTKSGHNLIWLQILPKPSPPKATTTIAIKESALPSKKDPQLCMDEMTVFGPTTQHTRQPGNYCNKINKQSYLYACMYEWQRPG